jgi:hypothetical protein
MNPYSGAIAEFETEADAKAAGHTHPLTRDEAGRLMPMNRHERRAEAARERKRASRQAKP